MPATEREGGGLARWNEPTLSRMAFEFLRRYIAYKRTSSLLEREKKKKLSGYTRFRSFFFFNFRRKFARSIIETRSRIVKET